jgi:inositol-pentakisphosphate 2-kinase
MDTLFIQRSSPSQWKYVSEGGATIVLAHDDLTQSEYSAKVLRLRKASTIDSSTAVSSTIVDEPDDPTVTFQHVIMERVIPPVHLPRLEHVQLSLPWLKELHDLQDHLRPEGRRAEGTIDFSRRKAILATNLITGNIISVEIKVTKISLSHCSVVK